MIPAPSRVSRPWLWLPSKLAHDMAPIFMPLMVSIYRPKNKKWRSFSWKGLHFDNPMGIAGGVDKTGKCLNSWAALGAGFVEVGTVTPEPQKANPGKIMDRDISNRALWNKMGFPNPGIKSVKRQIRKYYGQQVPLFVNVGKNRWTENDQAFEDYGRCMEALKDYADVFVVNLSSPNTKGLRDLLDKVHLKLFLHNLTEKIKFLKITQPILLKLSPDMEEQALVDTLETSCDYVDGWILTNTTKSRYIGSPFNTKEGGVSGEPLKLLSMDALKVAGKFKKAHPEKLLVSVGGITTDLDVIHRLEMGADLVQCYSSLVFEGPGFFQKRLKGLAGK